MREILQISKLRNKRRGAKINVKSGCRTCKIRKVKCDEGRPACNRCVSTGRVCDGYGIWGGGGNPYKPSQDTVTSTDNNVILRPQGCLSIIAGNSEEIRHYEWFVYRTSKKLPGIFDLTFWKSLLFQASLDEPAVLHAVLTLSSFHQRDIYDERKLSKEFPDDKEQFMLQHYTKAIHLLEPHFSSHDRASIRVALITCLVFICLEILRGHFETALTHLYHGLKILQNFEIPCSWDDSLDLKTSQNSADDGIVEAFHRLLFQVQLLKQSSQYPYLLLQESEPSPPLFQSISKAWRPLERLLNRIFHLTEMASHQDFLPSSTNYIELLELRKNIQEELSQWLEIFEASQKDILGTDPAGFVSLLIREYHVMANIMAETCLNTDDETVFDSLTEKFITLVNTSAKIWKVSFQSNRTRSLPGHYIDMARSMIDIGWIPPLYFTALKCRVHRIRLQAIRLMESASHREGIWDSKIAASVARTVMRIEEKDFYKSLDISDDFSLSSVPTPQDFSLPIIPQSYRIRNVKMILSNGMDNVFLFYKQRQATGDWKDVQIPVSIG